MSERSINHTIHCRICLTDQDGRHNCFNPYLSSCLWYANNLCIVYFLTYWTCRQLFNTINFFSGTLWWLYSLCVVQSYCLCARERLWCSLIYMYWCRWTASINPKTLFSPCMLRSLRTSHLSLINLTQEI